MSFLTTSEKTLESTRKSSIEFGESVKLEDALYCSISKYIITSKGLLEMASQTLWGQPIPNIFFASIRYILLRGSQHNLRNYYPNLTPDPTDPNNIGPVLEEFIQENQIELTNLIQKKIVQTKEVHHCTILISRLNQLRAHGFDKLNLIEIGINGGLNLNQNKYSYEFTRDTIQV